MVYGVWWQWSVMVECNGVIGSGGVCGCVWCVVAVVCDGGVW